MLTEGPAVDNIVCCSTDEAHIQDALLASCGQLDASWYQVAWYIRDVFNLVAMGLWCLASL
jgi:hypothetical protein